jgi:hypothetical protein
MPCVINAQQIPEMDTSVFLRLTYKYFKKNKFIKKMIYYIDINSNFI